MTFKPLVLADRPFFIDLEKRFPFSTSDVNFTNLFIWRDFYNFIWTEAEGCVCLIANPIEGPSFALPPLGGGDKFKAVDFLFSSMSQPRLSRVGEELAVFLGQRRSDLVIEPDPDNHDYVYLSEKLINLSGRKMHQKKNHYNYFINNYKFELITITEEHLDELVSIEDKWLISKSEKIGPSSHLLLEARAVHLLLENLRILELEGLAIKIDGRVEAFTLGQPLNQETALIHVEKANPEFRGIYVALCSNFCRFFYADKKYVNREQDLGLAGLRRSKESLKPDHLEKKFVIMVK
ncbi:MAG: phosphatidylglycerol lysyltransferase domain-containing protein [Deltaproteobacteria bacterium]|jgi:hypothetical protein|nr:phosphatidylglycerol lysyltransferase domain-containing protein [Deltaproteobacteria bacterium]